MQKFETLISVNNRGKIQVVYLTLIYSSTEYKLSRQSGQFLCKTIPHPEISGNVGLGGRTVIQQAELIFNSNLKKYLDKGYKKLSDFTHKPIDKLTEKELVAFIGDYKTDANNIPKPMLALSSDKCAQSNFERECYASIKLDGVRCLMYYKDGVVKTASRGGGDYDVSTQLIRTNPEIIKFFESNPEVILDGEIYHHGVPLQTLSGIARLKVFEDRCKILEYWVYDFISDKPFSERVEILQNWKIDFFTSITPVNIIEHYKLSGWNTLKHWHDKFVKEGYEGLVLRNPLKGYAIGKRSSLYMIKIKDYMDSEFKVIGWEPGLRPVEDMCFICQVPGKEITFKAKPVGDKLVKEDYIKNIEKLIGKMATVKYFAYSTDGVPTQPVFKSFREEGE